MLVFLITALYAVWLVFAWLAIILGGARILL
jgi:hypothetical protein